MDRNQRDGHRSAIHSMIQLMSSPERAADSPPSRLAARRFFEPPDEDLADEFPRVNRFRGW